ncbi:hypothetical protein QUA79_05960 [Microcoleus sp. F8-D1]
MIFAGSQAENPIARAIELPAAQVRLSIDCAILDFRIEALTPPMNPGACILDALGQIIQKCHANTKN